MIGIIETLNEVLAIKSEYSIREPDVAVRVSLIKNQGTNPQISQVIKEYPWLVNVIFNPYVNANHITIIVITG